MEQPGSFWALDGGYCTRSALWEFFILAHGLRPDNRQQKRDLQFPAFFHPGYNIKK